MYFENENLVSIRLDKEFEITLRSMHAQDESRNTSKSIRWSFQRKFEKGDIFRSIRILWGTPVLMVKLPLFQSSLRLSERYLNCIITGLIFGADKSLFGVNGD